MSYILNRLMLGVLFAGFVFFTAANAGTEQPFNPDADAKAEIASAIKSAQKNNRHILLVFGANWCPWCRALHHMMETNDQVKSYLEEHYEVVMVDVGRRDKNMDLDSRYGHPVELGLPALVVLDENGRQLTLQETGSLETADPDVKGHSVTKVMNFLKKWKYPAEK